jgi:hypothetical protein
VENNRKLFLKYFFLLTCFYGFCSLLFFLAEHYLNTDLLTETNFLNWDAKHYETIRNSEYHTGMVAFFPLFPLTWKITQLNAVGISIVNGFLFIISFSWIAVLLNIPVKNILLLASIPSIIFMFLPFSESIFFLSSVLLIAGLKKNNFQFALTGIFLCALTRPVAAVFIPAVILVYFLSERSRANFSLMISLIACCFLGTLFVFTMQYLQTGDQFAFFKVQKGWGNYLRLPSFPLNSWAGGFILRLDAITFFLGISSACLLAYMIFKKIKTKAAVAYDKPFIFSLGYLSFLIVIILLTRGGILNSLNRYLFCSAFFIVAAGEVLQMRIFSLRSLGLLFFSSGLCWILFGSYVHIQTLLKFELMSLYLILFFCCTSEIKLLKNIATYTVVCCNIIFMLIFYHRFLTGEWVG